MFVNFFFAIFAGIGALDCSSENSMPLEEARAGLAAVQAEYRTITALEADFVQQSYSAALDITEGSSGKAWFTKPGKMRWHYKVPEEQITLVEGTTVRLYQPLDQQVFIDEASEMLVSDLPIAFLMGIGDLEKDFTLRRACASEDGTVFVLDPRREEGKRERGLQSLKLFADKANIPAGVEVVDVGGNITSIRFRDTSVSDSLPDDLFKLDIPAGTDVIDRRAGPRNPVS